MSIQPINERHGKFRIRHNKDGTYTVQFKGSWWKPWVHCWKSNWMGVHWEPATYGELREAEIAMRSLRHDHNEDMERKAAIKAANIKYTYE